jgi:prepilin-type N-terminal cleavage/methylation domain-containing protein
MMRRRRRGFTFVELMIAMIIVGCLSAIAVPKYIDLKRRANTTKVIGDFQAVRIAVMSFYADSSYFPAESGPGDIPANLTKYLPIGFKFQRPEWTLDYENWDLGQGMGFTNSSALIGVTVICQDPALGETTSRLLGNVPQVSFSPSVTFMISGM